QPLGSPWRRRRRLSPCATANPAAATRTSITAQMIFRTVAPAFGADTSFITLLRSRVLKPRRMVRETLRLNSQVPVLRDVGAHSPGDQRPNRKVANSRVQRPGRAIPSKRHY